MASRLFRFTECDAAFIKQRLHIVKDVRPIDKEDVQRFQTFLDLAFELAHLA